MENSDHRHPNPCLLALLLAQPPACSLPTSPLPSHPRRNKTPWPLAVRDAVYTTHNLYDAGTGVVLGVHTPVSRCSALAGVKDNLSRFVP